jgi:hypothetical protein
VFRTYKLRNLYKPGLLRVLTSFNNKKFRIQLTLVCLIICGHCNVSGDEIYEQNRNNTPRKITEPMKIFFSELEIKPFVKKIQN